MRVKFPVIVWLVMCCAPPLLAAEGARAVKSIYYANADRTFYERFVRDEANALWWEGGNVVPSRQVTSWQKDVLFDEFTSAPLHDCSDAKFRCVYGLYRVFATPRAGLEPQSTYSAGGASFRVEKCLRSSKARCLEALISSDCQTKVEPDRCLEVAGGRVSSTAPGPMVYFIFKEKVGVTAYGDGKAFIGEEARLSAARHLQLHGRRGLLGNGNFLPVR